MIGSEQPLDAATRAQLTHQIAVTQDVAKMYPTVAAAEAAGYHRAGPYSPGLGAHYIRPNVEGLNFDGMMDDNDLLSPLAIIYAGTNPDSPIAGYMYYAMSKDEPSGFAGPNDHWHYHTNTCIKYNADGTIDAPFGADTEAPADLCVQAGGKVMPVTQWMVHVWSVAGVGVTAGPLRRGESGVDMSGRHLLPTAARAVEEPSAQLVPQLNRMPTCVNSHWAMMSAPGPA